MTPTPAITTTITTTTTTTTLIPTDNRASLMDFPELNQKNNSTSNPPAHTENMIEVIPIERPKLLRQKSASVPDLQIYLQSATLEIVAEEEDHNGQKTEPPMKIPTTRTLSLKGGWGAGGKSMSFRDVILSTTGGIEEQKGTMNTNNDTVTTGANTERTKKKIKPKFVVTKPLMMRRCSKSTGDLQKMAFDFDETFGETDAMEYYNRKAHGSRSRRNGLKIRPDEAKRRDISLHKRNIQRQETKC
eukprot:CAMPEP_0202452774 /NCGR_PEP_ID=MMETSP1360-20130828/10896_1 /ASSEMBLY_ACC=CAM_ASM_000848 /TAXON_ID=515479 /ORGANISM="Licmophora paradoxa, Strain CCMP2313" /LENGTH=244 /DNA_ID=CAMNT_0049071685 /DNA_START=96 /DNA_END=830 /DNA_ORIENTATION=-